MRSGEGDDRGGGGCRRLRAARGRERRLHGPDRSARPVDKASTGRSQDFNGNFDAAKQGSYVQIPFNVPPGRPRSGSATATTSRPPAAATRSTSASTSRGAGDAVYGPAEQRGWSGSAVKDLAISVNGYSPPATYEADRKAFVHSVHDPRLPGRPDPGRHLGGRARPGLDHRPARRPGRDRLARPGRDEHEPPAGPTTPYSRVPYDSTPGRDRPRLVLRATSTSTASRSPATR